MENHDIARSIATIDKHRVHAEDACKALETHIEHIKRALDAFPDDIDDEHFIKLSDPALQLRRDLLDTLKTLTQTNRNMCRALGIEPSNSLEQNYDRLKYHIGQALYQDRLRSLLRLLHELHRQSKQNKAQSEKNRKRQELLDALVDEEDELKKERKEVKSEKKQHEKSAAKHKLSQVNDHFLPLLHELHEALQCQAQFQFSLEQLTESLHAYPGLPAFGIFYDHVATLKGPVDRFFQALQNGMKIMSDLSEHLEKIYHPQLALDVEQQAENDELRRLAALARTLQLRRY
jgi:hypothetical protein